MNLTGLPPYQKSPKSGKTKTADEKRHMAEVAKLPCSVGNHECDYFGRTVTLHHCGCGNGGRKDHMKVAPLCWRHHVGDLGINGGKMSRREWESIYGTEDYHLAKTERLLCRST
jgi:hypothetical protein